MRIKELREKSDLTQKELAKMLSVTSQTILNWENEIYEPNISQLIKLADIFKVSLDYLVGRKRDEYFISDISLELDKISGEEIKDFIIKSLKNK